MSHVVDVNVTSSNGMYAPISRRFNIFTAGQAVRNLQFLHCSTLAYIDKSVDTLDIQLNSKIENL